MEKKRANLSQIMKQAWSLAKSLKISIADALKAAWKAAKTAKLLVKAQSYEYFEITFVKASTGEITSRVASNGRMKSSNLLFFSITDNGFRSCLPENILSIKPVNVQVQVL